MMIQNIIEILQITVLAAVVLFSCMALFLNSLAKRITSFLFLMIVVVISSLLLFSGVFALVGGILFIFFYALVYMFYFNQKSYLGPEPDRPNTSIARLIPIVVFCLGIGYLFYYFSFGTLSLYEDAQTITLMNFRDIAQEYFTGYFLVTAFVAGSLFITTIWFIVDIKKKRG